jgi:hypothetical protein
MLDYGRMVIGRIPVKEKLKCWSRLAKSVIEVHFIRENACSIQPNVIKRYFHLGLYAETSKIPRDQFSLDPRSNFP